MVITVVLEHPGDVKLLLPKLYNESKSQIDRIIFPLGRVNAPPNNQRADWIGVGTVL